MFGSNILEVATGIIFIYLLLSLACTVINEAIATLINQRGKILIAGIQNLLNDANLSGLAQQLYNHGFVAGISENGNKPTVPNGLPSYMASNTFALSLMDLLHAYGAIIKAQADPNPPALSDDLQKALTAFKEGAPPSTATSPSSGTSTPVSSSGATPAVSDKLTSATKLAQQLLKGGAVTQAILTAARDLNSKYSPWDSIKAAVAALPNSQTKDALTVLITKTESEVQSLHQDAAKEQHYLSELQQNVEHWFDQAMDRFAGWYKRWAQWITLLIALVIVVLVNADTMKIATKLLHDDALRGAVVSAAETAIQNKQGQDELLKQADGLTLPIGWTATLDIDTKDAASISVSVISKILGLAISILAISLGAPFWFDVLSKIINIRAAGAVPKSASKKAA
jgi:hypothetical protein